jgi:hypothetical protein
MRVWMKLNFLSYVQSSSASSISNLQFEGTLELEVRDVVVEEQQIEEMGC